jgi:hypothetical protein
VFVHDDDCWPGTKKELSYRRNARAKLQPMTDSNPFPLPPRLAALVDSLPMEEIAFTPVAVRARHDGWSPERQRAFIIRLALCGCVSLAAAAVGKTKKSVYDLRKRPDAGSFARAWGRALTWGRRGLHDRAMERALIGELRAYYYRGRKVADLRRYDNRMLGVVLRAAIARGDVRFN